MCKCEEGSARGYTRPAEAPSDDPTVGMYIGERRFAQAHAGLRRETDARYAARDLAAKEEAVRLREGLDKAPPENPLALAMRGVVQNTQRLEEVIEMLSVRLAPITLPAPTSGVTDPKEREIPGSPLAQALADHARRLDLAVRRLNYMSATLDI